MTELEQARTEIDAADAALAELFTRRMRAVAEVAAYKEAHGIPVFDGAREKQVIEKNAARIADESIRSYFIPFLQSLMDASKKYQSAILAGARVAYCGVEGAFADIAAKKIFPEGRTVPFADFEAAYRAVLDGDCECCVLPIENSYAGEVGQVLDLMFAGDLYINGVYDLPVTHHLLGVPGASAADVKTVVSHPQALAQCAAYIGRHGFAEKQTGNTALAAQEVASAGDPSVAAIASRETAALYGLSVLDHDIHERNVNTTRFAVFSRAQAKAAAAKDCFILLFTVNNVVGALAKAVNIICAHGFNMRVLRSRPVRNVPWQYYFYVEAEGDPDGEEGRRMLNALSVCCDSLKVVGHYSPKNIA